MIYIIICIQSFAFVVLLLISAVIGLIGGCIIGPIGAVMWAFQTFSNMLPFNDSSSTDIDVI